MCAQSRSGEANGVVPPSANSDKTPSMNVEAAERFAGARLTDRVGGCPRPAMERRPHLQAINLIRRLYASKISIRRIDNEAPTWAGQDMKGMSIQLKNEVPHATLCSHPHRRYRPVLRFGQRRRGTRHLQIHQHQYSPLSDYGGLSRLPPQRPWWVGHIFGRGVARSAVMHQ
jgi:hypothetical protein